MYRVMGRAVLAVGTLLCLSAGASAQQTTTSKATKAFEVIAVDGNQLVVKLPEGTRELQVPDDFRFTVDGRPLSVHELKPGMKGTATITTKTTTTPVTVTEVKNGTVMQASGSTIVVRTDSGIKMFTEGDIAKRGVKIMRDGQPASITDFHQGDQLTATIVTTHPPKIVTEKQVQATLARANAPAGAAAGGTRASAGAAGSAAAAGGASASSSATSGSKKKLPKTASAVPAVGLMGLVSLLGATALAARRRRLAH